MLVTVITSAVFVPAGAATVPAGATCGPSFQVVHSPEPPADGILEDVAAVSSDDVWAVGIDVEHWDGSQWSVVPSPSVEYLFGVAAVAPDDVWAVGEQVRDSVIEHWNGVAWTRVASPNPGWAYNLLSDVIALAPDDLWAVGQWSNNGATGSNTFIVHWDGTDWTFVPTPSPGTFAGLGGIAAVGPDDIWAVGGHDLDTLVEHWDGTAWTVVPSPNYGTGYNGLFAVEAFASNDVWAVGSSEGNGRSLVEHWDGSAWTIVPSPPGENGLFTMAAVSPGDIWATSHQAFPPSIQHWDGYRWTAVSGPFREANSELRLSGMGALPDGQVWAVGYNTSQFTTLKEFICSTQVLDSGFSPSSSTVGLGMSAAWSIPPSDISNHTITDDTGMGLFDSGVRPPGTSYVFRFTAAGTYAVIDRVTSQTGTISVTMEAFPRRGKVDTVFNIGWAAAPARPGFAFDVQILRPGSSDWADWMSGITLSKSKFLADAGTGVYSFRAQLRNIDNGASSDWSPVASVTVV